MLFQFIFLNNDFQNYNVEYVFNLYLLTKLYPICITINLMLLVYQNYIILYQHLYLKFYNNYLNLYLLSIINIYANLNVKLYFLIIIC